LEPLDETQNSNSNYYNEIIFYSALVEAQKMEKHSRIFYIGNIEDEIPFC
jgi:hypothetical protein